MQVLSNIAMIFKSLAVAFGKLLYLLLIKLYLAIPVLYLIGLWIASAAVPFRFGDYSAYIIVGTALCLALSILLVLRAALCSPIRKKTQRTGVRTEGEMETRPQENVAHIDSPRREEPAPQHTPVTQPQPIESHTAPYPPSQSSYAESVPPAPQYAPPAPTPIPRYETPRYYRTKKDPGLYIAEYSDRLELFRKQSDGSFKYIGTEMKDS